MPGEITYTDEELVARLRTGSHIERRAADVIERLLRESEAIVEKCAQVAFCHSDDRPRRDGMDWNDGYQDGCRGASEAIRCRLTPESWQASDGKGCAQHSKDERR